jgi:gas vesicle protein
MTFFCYRYIIKPIKSKINIMKTLLIITIVLLAIAGLSYILTKTGKVKDENKNNIPDEVEEKMKAIKEEVKARKEEVKARVERIKEEVKDVKVAVKEVTKQVGDVVDAAAGKKRRGRKPKNPKV